MKWLKGKLIYINICIITFLLYLYILYRISIDYIDAFSIMLFMIVVWSLKGIFLSREYRIYGRGKAMVIVMVVNYICFAGVILLHINKWNMAVQYVDRGIILFYMLLISMYAILLFHDHNSNKEEIIKEVKRKEEERRNKDKHYIGKHREDKAKFITENDLSLFRYHDAVVENVQFKGKDMIWALEAINVSTKNPHNSFDCDMQAGTFYLCFKNFRVVELISYGSIVSDKKGNQQEVIPDKAIAKKEYKKTLRSLEYLYSYFQDEEYPGTHNFEATTGPDVLLIRIQCSKAIAQWDSFENKAWYERYR